MQIPEKYDSLATSLSNIVDEARDLTLITVDGITYPIQYYLGGDMKFLAIVCGIEAANSNYACVWCKCSSTERWNMDGRWSAFDTSKGARTIQEIKNSLKLPKSKRFGCQNVPIFDFVPIDRVIIDTLFLRVSDLLTNLLIQDLWRLDGIAKACLD